MKTGRLLDALSGHIRVYLTQITASTNAAGIQMECVDDGDHPLKGSCINHSKRVIIRKEDITVEKFGNGDRSNNSSKLRENPTKSWRISAPQHTLIAKIVDSSREFAFFRALSTHMKHHLIKNKKEVHLCKECGRGFVATRVMFGHTKSHSQRLKLIDVEAYESVRETVMSTLGGYSTEGQCSPYIGLMDVEVSNFWIVVGRHLHMVATTLYAEKASHDNDLLVRLLPASISDYVELVDAPIFAAGFLDLYGDAWHLLLLGTRLDLSDVSNRVVDCTLLQVLQHEAIESDLEEIGDEVISGDGSNFEGGRNWAASASRKFEGVVLNVVEEAGQDSRYILQMIQAPATKSTSIEENTSGTPSAKTDPALNLASASAEEGLEVQIALEMASLDARQSAAEDACSKLCVLLQFRALEHVVIKLILCYIFIISALRTMRFSWEGELIGTRTTPAVTRAHPTKPVQSARQQQRQQTAFFSYLPYLLDLAYLL